MTGRVLRRTLVAAAILGAPTVAIAADLSGDWTISSHVGATPITIACTLVQTGAMLSGGCAPGTDPTHPTALTGTVEGAKASWGYDVVFRGKPAHVGYTAEVRPDGSMTGALSLAGKPSDFTAVRK